MGHIVRNEGWATVDLDTTRRHVFVREDWEYDWSVKDGQPVWTTDEQIAFHRFVDRSVWANWSHRVLIWAKPDQYARRHPTDQLRWQLEGAHTLSFDVRQTRANGHWRVSVTKVDPKTIDKPRAKVDFEKTDDRPKQHGYAGYEGETIRR